ncbi:pathogenesis-related protein pr-1 [Phtheirospermum japonicum]|uniref:Pathogenesis-related protein pr-1 n=1 Tax=Phtheirospermum japonicum TaxID=374723 RepID=A0A830C2U1_9LAMI|nr:pathogenesis-related protein pr-1 [Phtheirospermum japonicum]
MRPHYGNFCFILISLCLTTSTNAGVPKNAARQFMGMQNAARAALGLPPLIWDQKLVQYARSYARQRREDCALEHSHGPYGENIFWGSGDGWTPAQAAAAWVAERREYNYWSNSCAFGQQCGHYTQIVWRDTKKIGCAKVVCDGGKGVFMICNYNPPGNYIGERPY